MMLIYLSPYYTWINDITEACFVQDSPMEKEHRTYKTLAEIESKLSQLKQKKLILWGGKDFCFNQHFFERWIELWPDADAHWYAKAGHYVLEDALEDVSTRMWEFIKAGARA